MTEPGPARETGRGARTRERLVSAAQDLYAERGVAATTPRQVWEHSGVGQGSLYHHFPTKHALAVAAISRTGEQTLAKARADLDGTEPALERLAGYLSRPRDAVAGCRVGRLTSDPMVMAEPELQEPVRDYFTGLIDLVTELFVETGASGETARRRAMVAVAIIQGGYVLSRALDDPTPMETAVAGFLDLVASSTADA